MNNLTKGKKNRLSKTTYYNNEFKLKEYYAKFCRNLNCFGCVMFTVKEIIFDNDNPTNTNGSVAFKKVKRLLALRPNKILLIDYKTKELIRSERMSDLKSWFSGDGYYNLTPMFLLHPQPQGVTEAQNRSNEMNQQFLNQSFTSQFANLFRMGSNNFDMDKLFVIEFRSCKWHLQIDNFHSLKSITCILLDQSLDMGIDNNPLMLDLTISEHFQNRYMLTSPGTQTKNNGRTSASNFHSGHGHISNFYSNKKTSHHSSTVSACKRSAAAASTNSSQNTKSNELNG